MKHLQPFDTLKLFIAVHWWYTQYMLETFSVANFVRKLVFENFNTD